MRMAEFPATHTVHWPSGPVDTCEKHARDLIGIGNFLGSHIVATKAADGAECSNCANEAETETSDIRETENE